MGLSNKLLFLPLCIRVCIGVCNLNFVEHHQRAPNFDPGGICAGPLPAPPSTFARVQSSFEFVEIGGDVCSSCHGEVPAGTKLPTGASLYQALYMYEYT